MATTKIQASDGDGLLFDFFCTAAATPELFAADDVIFGGKLLPLWAPPPPPQPREAARAKKQDHRRSSSLGDPRPPARPEAAARTRRSSSDGKITGDWEHRKPKQQQQQHSRAPRWYVLVFGPIRANITSGMDIKQIRIRQHRRKEAASATAKGSGQWGPWKIVRSLSCKGVDAVDIVA